MKRREPKQVKTFSTDGRVYDWLVEKLQASDSKTSVSELINDYLGYLYFEVKSILDYYAQEKIKVDEPWVINKIIKDASFFPPRLHMLYGDPDMKRWLDDQRHEKAMEILEEYQREQKLVMNNILDRRREREKQRVSEIEKNSEKGKKR